MAKNNKYFWGLIFLRVFKYIATADSTKVCRMFVATLNMLID